MSPPLCAAIDVGSNSVKLLVGRPTGGPVDVVHDEVRVTRLSEGVDATGRLNEAAVARTLEALRSFAEACRQRGVERLTAVGTAVLRDAADGDAFLEAARGVGTPIEVVSGDAEAEIIRLAARHEVPGLDDDAALVDIGGGSTEVVWRYGRESTELGVVRLTERHVKGDPAGPDAHAAMAEVVRERLARLPLSRASALVGSSASCSLLARIHLDLRTHDAERIHGHRLPLPVLDDLAARLAASVQADRLGWVDMEPRRADVLLAGAVVLAGAARAVGVDEVVVSDRGTRYGVFHRAFR